MDKVFFAILFLFCPVVFGCRPMESIIVGALPSHQLPAVQVEARSPDRNGEGGKEEKKEMYLDNEVSITTPLTAGGVETGQRASSNASVEGELSEVDITSQHNSVISQTPDSTISGPVPVVICETPGRAFTALVAPKNLRNCSDRSPLIVRHHHGS